MPKKITTSDFIETVKKINGDKYDYSKVNYIDSKHKVCIICPKHGEFWQFPHNHKAGDQCPECSKEQQSIGKEEFIKRANKKYNNKYDYSKVIWKNTKTKVTIICPIHGEFEQTPERHLISVTGCSKCSRTKPRKAVIEGIKRKDMREYQIWRSLKTRTTNPNTDDYSRYMGRDITCCDRWLSSFDNFYNDMGPCPENFTIDRIDPNGNYTPENCRWASRKTQAENRGEFNLVYSYNGESHVLKEWSRIFNINYGTLYSRIFKYNLSFEDAIKKDPFDKLYKYNGEEKRLIEWAAIYNIPYSTVITRLHKHHWTLEETLSTPYKQKRHKTEDIV